jgi:hypothetical protein
LSPRSGDIAPLKLLICLLLSFFIFVALRVLFLALNFSLCGYVPAENYSNIIIRPVLTPCFSGIYGAKKPGLVGGEAPPFS